MHMKLLQLSLIFFLTFIAPNLANSADVQQATQDSFKNMVSACQNKDYSKAAGFMLYKGEDPKRRNKDIAAYKTDEEKEAIPANCEVILEALNKDGTYEFKEFKTEKDPSGKNPDIHIILIDAKTKPKELRYTVFGFAKVKESLVLVDMDPDRDGKI